MSDIDALDGGGLSNDRAQDDIAALAKATFTVAFPILLTPRWHGMAQLAATARCVRCFT